MKKMKKKKQINNEIQIFLTCCKGRKIFANIFMFFAWKAKNIEEEEVLKSACLSGHELL